MRKTCNLAEAADFLKSNDCFGILTHQFPDGDTLGSAYGLCSMLQQMGKKARVLVNGGRPTQKFLYLEQLVQRQDFNVENYVSVDVADAKLLGELDVYAEQVELAIDHHSTHNPFARIYYVNTLASNCENIVELAGELNVTITKDIADALYTGIATDTGCFRYTNTTSKTHTTAAQLMDCGCDAAKINKAMFETVSKNKKALESYVIGNMEYFCDDKIAVAHTTREILKRFNVPEDEVGGISAIPRTIEGVLIGITIRQKNDTTYKISVRTNEGIDASAICGQLGGGGHKAAAGCAVDGTLQQAKEAVLAVAKKYIEEQ